MQAQREGGDRRRKKQNKNLEKLHFLTKICLSAPAKFKVLGVKEVMNINASRKWQAAIGRTLSKSRKSARHERYDNLGGAEKWMFRWFGV